MGVINLREIPDELARLVKATAASGGMSLQEFVLGILGRDVKRGRWTGGREKKGQAVKTGLPVASQKPARVEE